MKKFYSLILLLALFVSTSFAQDRYLDEVFTDVQVTPNVTYGVNGTVLFIPQVGEVVPQALTMDIYEPMGDTETARPVILMFHTGNFLPNVTNGQISGTKQDSSVVEMCTLLAKRGYVAASVTYRQGWNPRADTQPIRALGLIQAAYRGVQDGRNAIRFMKSNASTYNIDTEKVTVWGVGTGGYLTLGLVGLTDFLEIPQTTNGEGKFLIDTTGDGIPDSPMVAPPFHGDIYGEVLTVVPFDAYGLMAGDTTNYPNVVGVDNNFQLGVNIGGAIGDISWLNDNDIPTISVQSAYDQFAPYNDDVLKVPTTGDPIVQVQGAQQIGATQEAAGNNQMWKDANFNDSLTMLAIANSATAGHDYYEGVFPWIKPANSTGEDEGVVVDWWDENAGSPVNGAGMGAPWNLIPHPGDITGETSYHEEGLKLNEGMGPEKARANIADIMGYVLPRACVALDLPCKSNFVSSTKDLVVDAGMVLSPNPASQSVIVRTDSEYQIQTIELFDVTGRLITQFTNIDYNTYEINRNGLAPGMYMIKANFEEGVQTSKFMFN